MPAGIKAGYAGWFRFAGEATVLERRVVIQHTQFGVHDGVAMADADAALAADADLEGPAHSSSQSLGFGTLTVACMMSQRMTLFLPSGKYWQAMFFDGDRKPVGEVCARTGSGAMTSAAARSGDFMKRDFRNRALLAQSSLSRFTSL
ncbi:hypothetical protein RPMA_23480 [Tardiphaga alba]|uniref:Uncharacterized protein n=1 Tax=Tardiphaga alba TaxID=340268 RepID=A0ABX8ACS0_9BRAD|nr:hypothetical protein [Tardiphaga alba]QUS41473.1 hypothetical protein RPMA_23480 [Tardiphaga alba]